MRHVLVLLLAVLVGYVPSAGASALQGQLELPVPRLGDVAQYVLDPTPRQSGLSYGTYFRWEGAGHGVDAEGVVRNARSIHVTHDDGIKSHRTLLLDAVTRSVFAQVEWTDDLFAIEPSVGDSSLHAGRHQREESISTVYESTEVPCGAVHAVQGHRVPLDQPILLSPPCRLGPFLLPGGLYRAQDVQETDQGPAVAWHSVANGTPQNHSTFVMSPALPYPVEIHVWTSTHEAFRFRLEAAKAGPKGFPAPAAVDSEPHRLATSPAPPWLIDDRGIEHPFPLSRAYELARDDLHPDGLGAFLDRHPGAYLWFARFWEQQTADRFLRTWTLAATNGDDSLTVCAQQVEVPSPPEAHERVEQVARPCPVPAGPFPPGAGHAMAGGPLPSAPVMGEVFTARSLLDRWARYEMDPGPATGLGWGFRLVCQDQACERSVPLYEAGLRSEHLGLKFLSVGPEPDENGAETGRTLNESVVVVKADGRTAYHNTSRWSDHLRLMARAQGAESDPMQARHEPGFLSYAWTSEPGPSGLRWGWTVAFAAVATGWLLWRVRATLAWSLYSRIEPPRALEHPARAEILQLVQAQPGIHFLEVTRRLGMSRGRVDHHLRKLEALGLIRRRDAPGHTAFYAAGPLDPSHVEARAVLRARTARAVLWLVVERPGLSCSAAARDLGLSVSTLSYHATRLARARLIDARREGPRVCLFPLPLAQDLAEPAPSAGLSKSRPSYS